METLEASVQYGDIKGNIAIDEDHAKGLHEFAQEQGIDTNKLFPIAVDFRKCVDGTIGTTIIAVDTNAHNIPGDYENIKDFIEQNDPVPVVQIDVDGDINAFFKHCKRVSITAERGDIGILGKRITS